MIKKTLILIFTILAAASCVYPYSAELDSARTLLVVDGDVIIGGTSEFDLSYVKTLGSGSALLQQPFAELRVEGSDGSVFTGKCVAGHGSVDTGTADAAANFKLFITMASGSYETDWMTPCSKPVIEGITFKVDESSLSVRFSCDSGGSHYVLYPVETWEYRSDLVASLLYEEPLFPGGTGAVREVDPKQANHYCWKSSVMPQMLFRSGNPSEGRIQEATVTAIPRTDKRISYMYRISLELRSISEGKFNWLSLLEKTSDNAGDLFAPTPSSIPGNVRCTSNPEEKVVGYVDATYSVRARRDISIREHNAFIGGGVSPEPVAVRNVNWFEKYQEGYLPLYKNEKEGNVYWIESRCVDCRLAGGTTERPEDWPDL